MSEKQDIKSIIQQRNTLHNFILTQDKLKKISPERKIDMEKYKAAKKRITCLNTKLNVLQSQNTKTIPTPNKLMTAKEQVLTQAQSKQLADAQTKATQLAAEKTKLEAHLQIHNKNMNIMTLRNLNILINTHSNLNITGGDTIMISNLINTFMNNNNTVTLITKYALTNIFEKNLTSKKYTIITESVNNNIINKIDTLEGKMDLIFIRNHEILQHLISKKYLSKTLFYGLDVHIEGIKQMNNKFLGVIVQSEQLKQKYIQNGVNNNLISILEPITFKYNFTLPKRNDTETRLIYCGTLRNEENILEIIEEFKKIHKDRPEVLLKFVYGKIVGDKSFTDKINAIIKTGVKGVIFKYNLSHRDACYEIATSDIGICWRKNGWGDNGEISTKVKEYQMYNKFCINKNISMNYLSDDQKCFLSYLKLNKINQIYISKTLLNFNRIQSLYYLKNYDFNNNNPLLLYGVYNQEDLEVINCHTGKIYIMFGGTDCDDRFAIRKKNMNALKKYTNVEFISNSDNMSKRLDRNKIRYTYLENDLVDYKLFQRPIYKNSLEKSIYIYDGTKNSDPLIYSKDMCDKIEQNMNNVKIYRTSKNDRVNNNDMPKLYSKFKLVLRLTINDGGSETTKECNALNIPIIHNNSKYGLKWKNYDDVVNLINNVCNNKIVCNRNIDQKVYIRIDTNIKEQLFTSIKILNSEGFNIVVLTNNDKLFNDNKFKYKFIKYIDDNVLFNKNVISVKNNTFLNYLDLTIRNKIIKQIFSFTKFTKNRFSIITPYYKKIKFIQKFLDSIKNQTYKNFELIIVNDDAEDIELDSYIFDFIQNNNSILVKYIKNYKNIGAYNSRNVGIFNSTGEYICILDPDDVFVLDKLEQEYNIFNNSKCDYIQSQYVRHDYNTNEIVREAWYGDTIVTYKRDVFLNEGLYDNTRFGGDTEFLLRIRSKNKYKEYKLPKITYIATIDYTNKENNLTLKYDTALRHKYVKNFTKLHLNNLDNEIKIYNNYVKYETEIYYTP